ncbi:hypothetical protein HDV63DRAFT_216549 [Trichoderma sp. SZMC 28014]
MYRQGKKEPSRHECLYSLHLPLALLGLAVPCHAMPCCVALFLCLGQDLCSSVEPERRMLVQGWIPEIRLHVIVLLLAPIPDEPLARRECVVQRVLYCYGARLVLAYRRLPLAPPTLVSVSSSLVCLCVARFQLTECLSSLVQLVER